MINITNKVDCCGCQACGDICGKKAISFQTDEEGIWYPVVDKAKCIDCGLCEKVCPIIIHTSCPTNATTPKCYVLQAPDSYDRLQSASGAAYTLLARAVFEQGGIVAGHIWDGDFGVKGFVSGNADDLEILRGTKYLQSNVEGIYLAVRQYLKENKLVLFSGTPCQNAAMRSFLRRNYDNLIMTDFVCMGIDSPLAFKKYIDSLERMYDSKVVYFKAKSKEVGWRYLTNKAIFEDGRSYFGINGRDANLNATFLNVLVRPSCYDCKFKGFPRVSDMTIGDYWRKKNDYDPLDDNTGTSYVMLHNEKAVCFFKKIEGKCFNREVLFEEIISANRYALESLPKPSFNRQEFYQRLQNEDFTQLVNHYSSEQTRSLSFVGSIKRTLVFIVKTLYFCRCFPMSFIRTLYYNLFSSRVKTNVAEGDVLILRNTKLKLGKGATIQIKGTCILDANNDISVITIGDNGFLSLDNNIVKGGASFVVEPGGSINVGYKTIIERHSSLFARSIITIGDFSLVGEDSTLDETNKGILYFGEETKKDNSIIIGTHVLINKGCIIKGGSMLKDEIIVREYSVVDGTFKSRIVIEGNPAKEVDNNINWKNNFENIWNFKN